ncbi:MAG: hypothetical protein HYZ62_01280 [Candidatus Andersenbacteria bacterium]|nr:hypothetical protein [Candidatus Andersenbacteria bacterium]
MRHKPIRPIHLAIRVLLTPVTKLTRESAMVERLHAADIFFAGHFYELESQAQFSELFAGYPKAEQKVRLRLSYMGIRIGEVMSNKLRARFNRLLARVPAKEGKILLELLQTPTVDFFTNSKHASALFDVEVMFVGDLLINFTPASLQKVRGIGAGGAAAITAQLTAKGLSLAMKIPQEIREAYETFLEYGAFVDI